MSESMRSEICRALLTLCCARCQQRYAFNIQIHPFKKHRNKYFRSESVHSIYCSGDISIAAQMLFHDSDDSVIVLCIGDVDNTRHRISTGQDHLLRFYTFKISIATVAIEIVECHTEARVVRKIMLSFLVLEIDVHVCIHWIHIHVSLIILFNANDCSILFVSFI